MKVKELIGVLKRFNPDSEILIRAWFVTVISY